MLVALGAQCFMTLDEFLTGCVRLRIVKKESQRRSFATRCAREVLVRLAAPRTRP